MILATGISLAICGFEIMFLGGVLFAWNPVLYTFIEDGIFADKCHHNNVTKDNETTVVEDCSERDSLFNLCYIIGSVSVGLSSFPFGVFFDRFGLRLGRIVASIFSLLGMLSWGFANKENPLLIYVGSILLGCTASFICTTNMHAAQLAGRRTGIVLALFVAVYELTGLWFSVVLILHQTGFHRKWSLIAVSLLIIPSTWNTFCLLPKFKIGMDHPEEESKGTISTLEKEIPNNKVNDKTVKDHTKHRVWYYIFSLVYILHLTWFCMMNISINTFYGTMVPWLTDIYPNDTHKVSAMVEMFGFLSAVCLIVSPTFGHLMDYFRNRCTVKDNGNLWLKARSILYPSLIVGVGEIVFNIVHLGRSEWTIYSLFVLNFIVTPAIYTLVVAFIPVVFPLEHYGKLLGLQFFFGSVIQFAQVPLLKWAQSTSFNRMRLFLLGLSVLCLVQPFNIMYKSRRAKTIQPTTEKREIDEQKSFIT